MVLDLIPMFLVLGLMGWTGIPLDNSTLMVGSIVIGLAVGQTIHFMNRFNRYYERSGDGAQPCGRHPSRQKWPSSSPQAGDTGCRVKVPHTGRHGARVEGPLRGERCYPGRVRQR